MTAVDPAREIIARELQQAVERLQQDIARVEFWADALGGFAKPIPDYDAPGSRLNEYMLRGQGGEPRRSGGGNRLKK